ncbi:MAG: aspartate carbamoyltransferase [Candidatus Levybacteria bacterium]|nr:aspartate carbamoyltransferase [Candidatus Levybacteria bacterium]
MKNTKSTLSGKFYSADIISLDQFDPVTLKKLFSLVPKMASIAKNAQPSKLLSGKIVTLLFYEPSSRTFASFAGAIKQLGGETIDILNPLQFSSVSKGENFEDTIRVFEAYCDAIIIRHPEIGTAKKAALIAASVPIINAGDGNGEHPTQALLDLYTIYEKYKKLDGLTGVMAGDPLNSRTIHSLIKGLSLYKNNTIYLLSPKELRLNRDDFNSYTEKGVKLIEIYSEKEIPKNANFWYWTRVQKERFKDKKTYEKVKDSFYLTSNLIKNFAGKDTILMDPLPRVGNIDMSVDQDPRALYLRNQIRNGMYVRMALLSLILNKK